MAALADTPTVTRLLLVNTAVLACVFVFLAVSPAPVTFPDDAWETALLAKGAALLLAANVLATRLGATAGATPRRGRRVDTQTDALLWLREYEHFHVTAADGIIGIVDEVLGDRDGNPIGFVVADGWLATRRFLILLHEVEHVDECRRTVAVRTRQWP